MRRTDRPRTRPARARVVAAPALLSAAALALVGCGGGDDAEPSAAQTVTVTASPEEDASSSPTPSEAASSSAAASATPSASASGSTAAGSDADVDEARLDRLEATLLSPETAPGGVFTDMDVQRAPLETLETSLTLTGVTPTGACADLIERIDTRSVAGAGAVLADYTVDPAVRTGFATEEPQAFTMVAASPGAEDLSGDLGRLAETCGAFGGDGEPHVEFTDVPGVEDAARVVMALQEGGDPMVDMVVGGESDGTEHVYMGMVNVEPETAAAALRAQVEAFQARER